MKRIATLLALVLAVVLAGSASAGNDSDKNHADYWETNGWTCKKFEGNDATKVKFAPFGGFTKYRLILKGGSKFNDGDGFRVIINPAFPNTWYDNPTAGTRTISHYIVCGKHKETAGPKHLVNIDIIGPKGDPWFRFILKNTSDTGNKSATCRIFVNGKRIVGPVTMQDGWGYKTGWKYVKPYSNIKVVCWSGGKKFVTRKNSGPGGWYGPLYRGFTTGFFPL